jgi:UDP-N-acetylmuramyl pentapeptide phosphotransferase/UDP-N-acetylglucosamine-1-phosphate transferase
MFPLWLLASLLIGLVGTWFARAYALRRGVVDAPGERRAHTTPTPRGGGVSIVVALLLAGVVLLQSLADPFELGCALAGLVLVAGVGLLDDHRPMSPWVRLVVQGVAAALLAAGVWHQAGEPILALAAFVLAMALTNIWNFMDGIDGIAATQALLCALAIGLLGSGTWAWWAFALAAATLGFLPFNFPKARIFLGDVGSGALGFALAALLIRAAETSPLHVGLWALPISAFAIDATLTLARRVLRGERWWQPHAQHLYQQWARRTGSHVRVTLAYAGWTLAAIVLMATLSGQGHDSLRVSIVVVAWYTAGIGAWWMLQREGSAAVKESTR